MSKITDRRLGIEVAALRQSLWRKPGEELGACLEDERPSREEAADVVQWIDTDIMIVDPLTKAMSSEKLYEALDTNFWNLKQPIESIEKKRLKQRQRRKTPLDYPECGDEEDKAEQEMIKAHDEAVKSK